MTTLRICFGFQFIANEKVLPKEFIDQSRNVVFLHFNVFLRGNEFAGRKKEKKVAQCCRVPNFSEWVDIGINKSRILC
jgi:hypothetical protein